MKRVVIVLMAGVGALATFAMPTEAEIAKVEPVVEELAKGDYAALKAGRRSPEQVAETLLGYVKDAESEAAKYVLLCKAFDLYLEHGPLSKARDVANKILPANVRGCNLNPFNERLGCALAVKDQWNYAFMAFNRCGGKMAEIVAWEKAYPETGITELTTGAVGEFWWELSEKHADSDKVAAALRAHAVRWFKEALKNNSLRGLRRTLATKRIAEVEKEDGGVQPASSRSADASSAADQRVKRGMELETAEDFARASAVKITKPAGKPITLNLGKGAKIEFIGCPAGEFMMGLPNTSQSKAHDHTRSYYHKVKITRPFWLAKYRTTHEMWNAYQKVKLTKADKVLGGMKCTHRATDDAILEFCAWLTKKCRSSLPRGYVVRVPTEAEWEYVYKGGATDKDLIYAKAYYHGTGRGVDFISNPLYNQIAVHYDSDVVPKLNAARISLNPEFPISIPVGTKQPNAWGFYDMLGAGGEMMQDCFDRNKLGPDRQWQNVLRYDDEETDPLRYITDSKISVQFMTRGGNNLNPAPATNRLSTFWGSSPCLRLCVGPDLIKEKGLKERTAAGANGKKNYKVHCLD